MNKITNSKYFYLSYWMKFKLFFRSTQNIILFGCISRSFKKIIRNNIEMLLREVFQN